MTAAAATRQQSQSLLFNLPLELRHRIYEYYLSFTRDDFADSLRPTHVFLDADVPHTTPLPSLMMTCKCAYTELAPVVHTTAAVRVHRPGARNERRIGFAAHGVLQFHRLRRLVLIVDLDYAYWNAWLDFFATITTRVHNLEHLTIDWAPRTLAHVTKGWEARRDEKKEDTFFDLLYGVSGLQTLSFYGQIPERWAKRLQQWKTDVTVKQFRDRWWMEPGLEW